MSKKHTSEECLAFMIELVNDDPMVLRKHINTLNEFDNSQLRNIMWPAVFDEAAWFRTATRRPGLDTGPDAPFSFGGNDKVVRYYINETWEDNGHKLEMTITEEHGRLEVLFDVAW